MDWTFLLFSLHGRISRKDFWIGQVIILALYLATFLLFLIFWLDDFLGQPTALWMRQVGLAADLVLAWPAFAINAKRQQDRGHRPWLAWIFVVLTLGASILDVAGFVETVEGFTTLGVIIFGLLVFFFLVIVIELGIRKGISGPNTYGPDPLNPH